MKRTELLKLPRLVRSTPAQLRETEPTSFAALRARADEQLKANIVREFTAASSGVRKVVEELDLSGDGEARRDTRAALLKAFRARGVPKKVAEEGLSLLTRSNGFGRVEDPLQPDVPLGRNPLIQNELAEARTILLGKMTRVGAPKIEALLDRGLTVETLNDDALDGLVNAGTLSDADAGRLGLAAAVLRLTNDLDVTDTLVRRRFATLSDRTAESLRDLARLSRADVRSAVRAASADRPEGTNVDGYADELRRRLARLYPTEALLAVLPQPDARTITDDLNALATLRRRNDSIVGSAFGSLDTSGLRPEPRGIAQAAHERMRRLANTYLGLRLVDIVDDPALDDDERTAKIAQRLQWLTRIRQQNPDVELLALDYTPGSADVAALDLGGLAADERRMALDTLKAHQRIHAITADVDDAQMVLAAGYDAAVPIARGSVAQFARATGLDKQAADRYHATARTDANSVAALFGAAIEVVGGGSNRLRVDNLGVDIENFLRRLPGYESLFGSLAFCNCGHCQSILGPAAYFVDLMRFVETNVLNEVFTGPLQDHELHLRQRRPDLWTLPLTCANTDTRVPTLDLVNEILENYVFANNGAGRVPDRALLNDRGAVDQVVYRQVLNRETAAGHPQPVHSFRQPFVLPLEKLHIYLGHFDRSLDTIARVLEASPESIASAALWISAREHALIATPNTTLSILRQVYGLPLPVQGGVVAAFDAHDLLPAMGLTKKELDDLLGTRFVNPPGPGAVTIRAEKRDANSVQNDVENVHNLTAASLDRMHRFTRLWRRLGWSMAETDLALGALAATGLAQGLDAAALAGLADLLAVRQRFNISVEETLALCGAIPSRPVTAGQRSLFDRLFNLPPFERLDGPLPPPNPVSFVHPSFRSAGAAPADNTLNRLLAGLRVSDESLSELITHLAGPLGADLAAANEDDRGFSLTAANLTVLYSHARLAAQLKLPVAKLFQLIDHLNGAGVLAAGHVRHVGDVMVLLDWFDWQAQSGYSLDDLGYVTNGRVLAAGDYPLDPQVIVTEMVETVRADRSLVFADTVLAYLTNATEQHSRAVVIAAVQAGIVEADPAGGFRLTPDFGARVAIPVGNPISAIEAHNELLKYHSSEVIVNHLAERLNLSPAKLQAMIAMLGVDLGSKALVIALQGNGRPDDLVNLVRRLLPLTVLFKGDVFDPPALELIRTHAGADGFAINDFAAVTLPATRRVSVYSAFTDTDRVARFTPVQPPLDPADVRQVLADFDAAVGFANADDGTLARALGAEVGLVRTLRDHLSLPADAPSGLAKLGRALELARLLGVGGEALSLMVSNRYDDLLRASDAVVGAFRAKYDDERKWNENVEPYDDQLRSRRRDALVDHLLHPARQFASVNDLNHHFLVDVGIGGCARTSRLVAAINSVRRYVHRCLNDLEQDRRQPDDPQHVAVDPGRIPADEWEWRERYRVWEANRKVFLYPENYIEPDLRDDKSPLFEQLEATLLQQQVNEQTVLDAYATYLRGFEEVARLSIAGAFHDYVVGGRDVLHLFGATQADPPLYYYRTAENLLASESDTSRPRPISWSAWRTIDVQIPTRRVAPIVYRNQLYVFWQEITTTTRNRVEMGTSTFDGYKHALSLKYTTLRLDGTWTAPQPVTIHGILGDGTIIEPAGRPEPVDGHTLTGYRWEQPYPGAAGRANSFHLAFLAQVNPYVSYEEPARGVLDLYRRRLEVPGTRDIEDSLPGLLYCRPPEPGDGPDDLIFSYSRPNYPLDISYALASRDLERARLRDRMWLNRPIDVAAFERQLDPTPLLSVPPTRELAVVNGRVNEAVIDVAGDLFLLSYVGDPKLPYVLRRLGTTIAERVSEELFTEGVDALLDTDHQARLFEADSPLKVLNGVRDDTIVLDAAQARSIDYRGPYGVYYREIFFHIPFLLANHLNSQGRFAAAQRWYHYLFNPTAADDAPTAPLPPDEVEQRRRDRPWRYREFRNRTLPILRDLLQADDAIAAYQEDPFNPHAIARLRFSAYQKSIVMKYIDNLLDWGDSLFAQFTSESLDDADLLYTMASDILGERPPQVGDCGEAGVQPRDYATIGPLIKSTSPFLIEFESAYRGAQILPRGRDRQFSYRYTATPTALGGPVRANGSGSDGAAFRGDRWRSTHTSRWEREPLNVGDRTRAETAPQGSGLVQSRLVGHASPRVNGFERAQDFTVEVASQIGPVFCVPPNRDLLDYWDRVEGRLDNIRNCRDITGATRTPPLFAPVIDPRLLVRARAAGLTLEDVLNGIHGDLPPYRFTYLIEQAKAFAAAVQTSGSALLSALANKDVEELTQLRTLHQQNLLALTARVRESELRTAEEGVQLVDRQIQAAQYRFNHYHGLIDGRLSPAEHVQQSARNLASGLQITASIFDTLAAIVYLVPQVGSPFALTFGGKELGDSGGSWSEVLKNAAVGAEARAASAGLEATFKRREEEWEHQRDVANHELKQLDKQRIIAEIRRDVAQIDLDVHRRSIAQLEEEYDFYVDKFSNLGLYTWLSTTLQTVHREAYNSAFAMARLAEQAFRFERSDEPALLISPDQWDPTHAGLLAGERLLIDLQAMERRYIETNYRTLEIDQSFSLRQIAPAALLALRQTGNCRFAVRELPFDLVYPGHYRRRIKSVRLTIPCVTGPYTNIGATLTLVRSFLRKDPRLGGGDRIDPANLVEVPLQRTLSIATSTARNDAGVLEFSFRDERLLPFEGAGAVSEWTLELPRSFRQFDYDTITDVVLHISYTAEQDSRLRTAVENLQGAAEGQLLYTLANDGTALVLNLRHEFSTAFHLLLRSPRDTAVPVDIGAGHFPMFLRFLAGWTVAVSRALLALDVAEGQSVNNVALTVNGTTVSGFAPDQAVAGLPAVDVTARFAQGIQARQTIAVADAGDLAPDAPEANDRSALDENKLRNVLLYIEYRLTR